MVELKNKTLRFSFPEVHKDAVLEISLKRTLRVPDDDRLNLLPPGFDSFALEHVADHARLVPPSWREHGGVMLPMYASEAMWIRFRSPKDYPFAVKVASGKCCALTGETWINGLTQGDRLNEGEITNLQNYLIVPQQPWLDGFNTGNGEVRQFVAEPLGEGITVEEQLTGEAENGGLQIQVYPLKRVLWLEILEERRREEERRLEELRRWEEERERRRLAAEKAKKSAFSGWWNLRKKKEESCSEEMVFHQKVPKTYNMMASQSDRAMSVECSMAKSREDLCFYQSAILDDSAECAEAMGLAAGGRIRQEIYKDERSLSEWDDRHTSRVFVHLLNAQEWRYVTGKPIPHKPFDTNTYNRHGFPWYDHYSSEPSIEGSSKLAKVKTVAEWNPALSDSEVADPKMVIKTKRG